MSLVVETMQNFKAALLAREQQQMQSMGRRWRALEEALQDRIEVFASRVAQDGLTVGQLQSRQFQLDRYASLLRQVQREHSNYADYADGLIQSAQRHYGQQGINSAVAAIRAIGVRSGFDILPVNVIENMVGLAGDGSPLQQLLQNSFSAAADGMLNRLIEATALGYNPQRTARMMVRDGLSQSLSRMMTISRSEQLRVYRQSSQMQYQASGVVSGSRRLSAHDSRVCAGCLAADGQEMALGESFKAHPNCVVEGTVVSAPSIVGTSKRFYNGFVFDILTASGNHLTVTPNHPILTDHGWVAANLVNVGDNVISSFDSERSASLVDPNDQHRPAIIEDVIKAFRESVDVSSVCVPISAVDFHGDVIDSNVAIISANRFLLNGAESSVYEPFSENVFLGRCVRCGSFSADGSFTQFFPRRISPSGSILGFLDSSDMFLMGRLSGSYAVSRGNISDLHSGKFQSAAYDIANCAIGFSERILGFAGQVSADDLFYGKNVFFESCNLPFRDSHSVPFGLASEQPSGIEFIAQCLTGGVPFQANILDAFTRNIFLDSVVQVSSRYFGGHVYNLETNTGWYVAQGIVTHNCRCTTVPIVKGFAPPQWKGGGEWFSEQPEATQRKILGPTRYAMYKDGMPFENFASTRSNATWGDAIVPATVQELRQIGN